MNTNPPSVDQFLASSEPDEDDTPDLSIGPGTLWQIPSDPMERVAAALESIVEHFTADKQDGSSDEFEQEAPHTWAGKYHDTLELLQSTQHEMADLEAKHQTVLQVISDVEAALGKSKAAPALAARAVIDAWRNPVTGTEGLDNALETYPPGGLEPVEILADPEAVAAIAEAEAELKTGPNNCDVEPIIEGHTRTPHPEGADFCRECSGALQEWIVWPCPSVSGEAQPLATGPEEGHEPVAQPEHGAPVEEWRAYARALGFAGPEIDKANRSMIRTTLGIAQVS